MEKKVKNKNKSKSKNKNKNKNKNKINKKETVIYITAAMNMCTYKSICSTVIQ